MSSTFIDELCLLMIGFDRRQGAEIVLNFKCLVLSWDLDSSVRYRHAI